MPSLLLFPSNSTIFIDFHGRIALTRSVLDAIARLCTISLVDYSEHFMIASR